MPTIPRIPAGTFRLAACCLLALGLAPAQAGELETALDLRYRLEAVDDEAFERDATAHTLRARLDLGWRFDERWRVLATLEGTGSFDDGFNSTRNGVPDRPVVADPDNLEIDQLLIGYRGERLQATFGRQVVALDDQRHVGAVGWRQNRQTFDAASFAWQAGERATLRYHYLDRVIRVFGEGHPNADLARRHLDGHLLNFAVDLSVGQLVAYGYRVEDGDVAVDSTRTLGLRFATSQPEGRRWKLLAEAARQNEAGASPLDYAADYWRLEGSWTLPAATVLLGVEELGSDGSGAFRTPLATGHAFNGWADRFLATPVDGLRDVYLGVAGALAGGKWSLRWHQFDAARGGADYGSELDASWSRPLGEHTGLLLKYAGYRSDGFAADVDKFWLQLELKY